MGLKRAIQKVADRATLKLAEALNPDGVEEDSPLDLKIEEIEGRKMRSYEPPPLPAAANKPVYRSDGQVHNFNALPFPGSGRRLTAAQYEARYAGARPEPKHSVAGLVDMKEPAVPPDERSEFYSEYELSGTEQDEE